MPAPAENFQVSTIASVFWFPLLPLVLSGGYFLLTFTDSKCRAPLISQNVQTDAAVAVDIGVVDAGGEVDLWRLERVVGREMDGKEEDAAGVGRVAGTHDCGLPVEL